MKDFTPSTDNRNFATGAVRGVDDNRGTASLLPFHALSLVGLCYGGFHKIPVDAVDLLAKLYQAGAKKYAARNWEKGIPLAAYLDSAWRHYAKWRKGMVDEPHTVQFAWNALCMLQTHVWIANETLPKELNTLPNVACNRHDAIQPSLIIVPETRTAEQWADLAWGEMVKYMGQDAKHNAIVANTFSLQYVTQFAAYAIAVSEADNLRTQAKEAK